MCFIATTTRNPVPVLQATTSSMVAGMASAAVLATAALEGTVYTRSLFSYETRHMRVEEDEDGEHVLVLHREICHDLRDGP